MPDLPTIRVTEVGEFIRFKSCARRFKLSHKNRELANALPFAGSLFSPLDPVLQASGKQREIEWESYLRAQETFTDLSTRKADDDVDTTSWDDFHKRASALPAGQNAFAREVHLSQQVGGFQIVGRVDFALIIWVTTPSGELRPRLSLVECKASRKDKTYHRAQLTLYKMMVARLLENGFTVAGIQLARADIDCVVARIDENTNKGQSILELPPLNLDSLEADLANILGPDAELRRLLASELDELPFQLESKCDDCVFNVHCFPESARQKRLELLACDASTIRVLKSAGIDSLPALSSLDLKSKAAAVIRSSPNFSRNLEVLCGQAKARLSTLPDAEIGSPQVTLIDDNTPSQLPRHEADGHRLMRVYLCIDFDYTENRLIALTAHITDSEGQIHTQFKSSAENKLQPDPDIRERAHIGFDQNKEPMYEEQPLRGVDVVCIKQTPWTGIFEEDLEAERELIETFLIDIISGIAKLALEEPQRHAVPIHFYVWERAEIGYLVDGCSRGGSILLENLRELLGCREPLEQLIYSCMREEVDRRYGLGWTGRGLCVVTDLDWFGNKYHWTRHVNKEVVQLNSRFAEDLFDFRAPLALNTDHWATADETNANTHQFEIRSRFHDSLSAPYWHAHWGILPKPESAKNDANLAAALTRYYEAAGDGMLEAYLHARVHALRWVEEQIKKKNSKLAKAPMPLMKVPQFNLGVSTVDRAAVDCLRIDHHVKHNDWIRSHLVPPKTRVGLGRTIPLKRLRCPERNVLVADIHADKFDLGIRDFEARCTFGDGDFVRVTKCSSDPNLPQSLDMLVRESSTCIIDKIDWAQRQITLRVIPQSMSDLYRWRSYRWEEGQVGWDYATLDESPSEYVSARVDKKLSSTGRSHAYTWFDPLNPQLPDAEPQGEQKRIITERFVDEGLKKLGAIKLAPDQRKAVLLGLDTRVQLLQGPPGTGKTMTTAAAILTRLQAYGSVGSLFLLSSNTHTAIDTLLERLAPLLEAMSGDVAFEYSIPRTVLLKAASSEDDLNKESNIKRIKTDAQGARRIATERRSKMVILAGTTGALLKLSEADPEMRATTLIIDEASMLVFPHFLALSTIVSKEGNFMLAGDHRQLAPILAHDWENEDRPPTVIYQPHVSAYEAVRQLSNQVGKLKIDCSALQYTFRLPDDIRQLIARLYQRDDVVLQGRSAERTSSPPQSRKVAEVGDVAPAEPTSEDRLEEVWNSNSGLFLISHNESQSNQNNETEVRIIENLLRSAGELPPDSVAIVTPHRAQRTLLQARMKQFAPAVSIIDTVERLQGGERPTVIFSATVSDPAAIASNVEFILDLNRSNVAFSRAMKRLIVVCSRQLMDFIPSELDHYEETLLWKALREICSDRLSTFIVNGFEASLLRPVRSSDNAIYDESPMASGKSR